MLNTILKLISALTLVLALSACSDLKKEVTIKTIGGEKKTLNIKAPKEFKKDKEAFFVFYTFVYMAGWNEGVDESDSPQNQYKFDLERFAKSMVGTIQANPHMANDLEEYFEKGNFEEKFKA